jgi:hypothetical protein
MTFAASATSPAAALLIMSASLCRLADSWLVWSQSRPEHPHKSWSRTLPYM